MMAQAVAEFEASRAIEPNNPDVNMELAGHLLLSGNADRGFFKLEQGLEGRSEEDVAATCMHVAGLCEQAGRHEEALRLMEKALKATPDDPDITNRIVWLRSTSTDPKVKDAAKAIELALKNKVVKDQMEYYASLATAYAASGDLFKATESADSALREAKAKNLPADVQKRLEEQRDSYAEQAIKGQIMEQLEKAGQGQKGKAPAPTDGKNPGEKPSGK
jgi:tetratricopeptide (TPR) repeat protein